MIFSTIQGILLPFLGTGLGAACIFFLRGSLNQRLQQCLNGLAAGIMTAAAYFSLLAPALEDGQLLPVVLGLLLGMFFLRLADGLLHRHSTDKSTFTRTQKMLWAVTVHNLPEGMAVGAAFAGCLWHHTVTEAAALALSIGIALQNFPEGAIVSLPLGAGGMKKRRAFLWGVLSGAIEPVGALMMLFFARLFQPILPFLLAFAAGAMLSVAAEELLPESRTAQGAACYALGFALMMIMDVALG